MQFPKLSTKTKAVLKSFLKVWAAALLGAVLADGADVFAVDFSDARVYLATALASALPILITALDGNDTRWGTNSSGEDSGATKESGRVVGR